MKKIKKENNLMGFDADSLWSRLSNKKSMKSGKTIQQILGIEDTGIEPLGGKKLSMMDFVMPAYEDENEEGEDE